MNEIYQGILAVSSYIIIFGLIGKLIRDHLNVTEPILATIYGIVLGPDVSGIFTTDPVISKRFLFAFSRIVLSFQIMTISLQLPNVYVYKKMRSLFVLLFPASLLSALIVFLLVYFFTKYDLVTSWAIASACTPTDPVLSSSIMKGEFANTHIPERIRLLLAAESGLNDGVGIVFIYLILSRRNTLISTVNTYFINAIVLKTLTAGITGYLTGLIFGIALKFCHSRRFVARNSVTVFGIALSLFCMCLAIFLNQSELIFIFFTGIAFSKSEWFVLETRGSQFQLLVESVFNISFLIFFGSRIHWKLLNFSTFLVSLSILLLRRPLAILCLYKYIPVIHTKKDAFILAWFGPIGVGSLYYAVITDKFLKTDTVEFISFLMVFSVFLHGLSVPIFIFFRYLIDNFYKFRNREVIGTN